MPKIRFSKSAILHRVRKDPVKLLELAQGSENHMVRKRLMRHINALVADGAIIKIWMQGFPHYVKAGHETTDDDRMRMLLENCRPIDGCMVWASYIDPQRGPLVRLDTPKPVNVRRFIWGVKRAPIDDKNSIVRMRPDCEHGCIEYTHMRLGRRNEHAKGQALTLMHRLSITAAKRASVGKLDWDKVRAIRASTETRKALAARYGVSATMIGKVIRQEVWAEGAGMFTGLLRRAA